MLYNSGMLWLALSLLFSNLPRSHTRIVPNVSLSSNGSNPNDKISTTALNTTLRQSTWPRAPFSFHVPDAGPSTNLLVLSYNVLPLTRQELYAIYLIHRQATVTLGHLEPDTELPSNEIVCKAKTPPHATYNMDHVDIEIAFLNSESEYGRVHTAYTVWTVLDMLVLEFMDNKVPWEGHHGEFVLEIVGILYRRVFVRRRHRQSRNTFDLLGNSTTII